MKVEGVINSVAITCESIGDVSSIIPLNPMQLLISETRVVMPPPGTFQKGDMYRRKQWQHVQHLSNEFWTQWRKEVFAKLQTRLKLNQIKQNFKVGNIVLVCDNITWSKWPIARILRTYSNEEGLVRNVQLVTQRTSSTSKETSVFEQPINKLILLVENELWRVVFKNIGVTARAQ